MQKYVEMFLFSSDNTGVVLQRAPRGVWTGVFGPVRENESELDAAKRVFAENSGMVHHRWQFIGQRDSVYMFTGESSCLEYVNVQHRCIVDVIGADDTVNRLSESACIATATRMGTIIDLVGPKEEMHPQLEPAQGTQADFSKGLKIGIACNEYTHFNKLVQKLRAMPENLNNRFYCVLSTTNIYGQTFDFFFKHEADGALCNEAANAVYVMGIRGMKESPALFDALIKPAYAQDLGQPT